jgi:hypothetical protein
MHNLSPIVRNNLTHKRGVEVMDYIPSVILSSTLHAGLHVKLVATLS